MYIKQNTKEAYKLLHEGALALAEIEQNGIMIDVTHCKRQDRLLGRKIDKLKEGLNEYEEIKLWRKLYGDKFNLNSPQQLSDILFNQLKIKSIKKTAGGGESTDTEVLDRIDLPFIDIFKQIKKFDKLKNTFLAGLLRESVGGVLRPFFNLHIVKTFRSSSSNPNFQNLPIRDKEQGAIIRKAFIPRDGHQIGGLDYSGIEVKIACAYHKDPVMIKYVTDPESDMHRDTGMDLFILSFKQMNDDIRFYAKNRFVFAQFYGDWYKNCAKNLWASIKEADLKRADGMSLKEHLKEKGITSYKKFENHVRDVEDRFWNEKFKVYQQWKDEHVARYEKDGYVNMFTGFQCKGFMKRNEVINYPVQGTAFHCLLWSLPKLLEFYKSHHLRSKIIGQIHDEVTMDNYSEELDFILTGAEKIMCQDIRKEWEWINVPLQIEAEFAGVNENWFKKKKVSINIKEPF